MWASGVVDKIECSPRTKNAVLVIAQRIKSKKLGSFYENFNSLNSKLQRATNFILFNILCRDFSTLPLERVVYQLVPQSMAKLCF